MCHSNRTRSVRTTFHGRLVSLGTIYAGKRFILEMFEAGVRNVIGTMGKDYELIEEGKAEGLRGLAPVLKEKSQFFDQQSRALHKTVRVADLPTVIGDKCLEVCGKMDLLCQSAMRLADRLARKPVLESSGCGIGTDNALKDQDRDCSLPGCLELINKYRSYFSQ